MKLYPIAGVPAMKERAEREQAAARAKAAERARPAAGGAAEAPARPEHGAQRAYTPDQVTMVRKILAVAKKGHYEVLGVPRSASEDEIKKVSSPLFPQRFLLLPSLFLCSLYVLFVV